MELILDSGVKLVPIPVAPNDDYMAGDDGRIYSRTKFAGIGVKGITDWYPLVGHRGKKGYYHISMCHKNRKVTKTVHRLVCIAFHGLPPLPSYQVRHLDGNPENNTPGNLCWGTQVENWQDRRAHGRARDGEEHPCAKFTNEERMAIRWAVEKGLCSERHAARMLGVTYSAVRQIVTGRK